MLQKFIIYILLIFSIFILNPSYAFNDINKKNNEFNLNKPYITLPVELYSPLKNLHYNNNEQIIKNIYNENIILNNDTEYAKEFFEFIGVFITDYKSQENFKIKLKFTHKAQLNRAKFYWQVNF